MKGDARFSLRKNATEIIRQRISELNKKTNVDRGSFDIWHYETCRMIRKLYEEAEIKFSWGQAQKWLNMTIKYLYIIGGCPIDDVFPLCHIPVDEYVIRIAEKELYIPIPKNKWSKWSYFQYMAYQGALRSRILDRYNLAPLRWEFKSWLKEVRRLKEGNRL